MDVDVGAALSDASAKWRHRFSCYEARRYDLFRLAQELLLKNPLVGTSRDPLELADQAIEQALYVGLALGICTLDEDGQDDDQEDPGA